MIRVIINSNSRNDAFQKIIVVWVNGTVINPDGTRVMTGIKIPFIIDFPNLGPPIFSENLGELKLSIGK